MDPLAHAASLAAAGRFHEAESAFRRALAAEARSVGALAGLGATLAAQGRLAEAVPVLERAVALDPHHASAQTNLGAALLQLGQAERALAAFAAAARIAPGQWDVHFRLGLACAQARRFADAAVSLERARALSPTAFPVLFELARACLELRDYARALRHADEALALDARVPKLHNMRGVALAGSGDRAAALDSYRRAIALQPDLASAHANLGLALYELGRCSEAVAAAERALALDGRLGEALNTRGLARLLSGDIAGARADFHAAAGLGFAPAASNALMAMQYDPALSQQGIADAHFAWGASRPRPPRPPRARDPARPLRIGYLSADLRVHPIGWFLLGVIPNHSAVEAFCYYDRAAEDEVTRRLRAGAKAWRAVAGLSDAALAARIAADGIDILVDLAGHFENNRLGVFALRPAPRQVTWAGYVGTTGLPAMDAILADRFHIPEGEEPLYRERVVRLPHGYVCYTPPEAPPVTPPPLAARGRATFGCFNNPGKINEAVLAAWARLLAAAPESRLVLRYRALDDPANIRRIRGFLERRGIAPGRLALEGLASPQAMLGHYAEIDVALDTFPYSGGLTTLEALWMGVPVVTWPADRFAGRHSLSHLSNAGLGELVARSLDEYVEIARRLAGDAPRLSALRQTMRARLSASPLLDGPGFTRALEAAYRDVAEGA